MAAVSFAKSSAEGGGSAVTGVGQEVIGGSGRSTTQ
jgi:hypothetical protein